MVQLIFSALGVFISTSIDYLILLVILFAQKSHEKRQWQIFAGQYLGTALLIMLSLIAVYFVHFIPEDWIIGLLGLIPIYLGIRFFFSDEEENEEEIEQKIKQTSSNKFVWTVTLLTLASGGDNLGIYIPYFASLDWSSILFVIGLFAIAIMLLCILSQRIASIPFISETLEKYEKRIVPPVFILLGLYILIENGTLLFF